MKKFMIGFIVTITFLALVALGCVGTSVIVKTIYNNALAYADEYPCWDYETENIETETILYEDILREEVAR